MGAAVHARDPWLFVFFILAFKNGQNEIKKRKKKRKISVLFFNSKGLPGLQDWVFFWPEKSLKAIVQPMCCSSGHKG